MSAIEQLGALLNEYDIHAEKLAADESELDADQEKLDDRRKDIDERKAAIERDKAWSEAVKQLISEVGERDKNEQSQFCGFAARIVEEHEVPRTEFERYADIRKFPYVEPEIEKAPAVDIAGATANFGT